MAIIESILISEGLLTWIMMYYCALLWTVRHKGAYPVLSREQQHVLLRLLIQQGETRISHLRDEWGIPRKIIKIFYAAEMREYRLLHPVAMKIHRPISPEIKERSRKLREERLQRERLREEVNTRSYMKLDEAIRARAECSKSVTDYFYHRNG